MESAANAINERKLFMDGDNFANDKAGGSSGFHGHRNSSPLVQMAADLNDRRIYVCVCTPPRSIYQWKCFTLSVVNAASFMAKGIRVRHGETNK